MTKRTGREKLHNMLKRTSAVLLMVVMILTMPGFMPGQIPDWMKGTVVEEAHAVTYFNLDGWTYNKTDIVSVSISSGYAAGKPYWLALFRGNYSSYAEAKINGANFIYWDYTSPSMPISLNTLSASAGTYTLMLLDESQSVSGYSKTLDYARIKVVDQYSLETAKPYSTCNMDGYLKFVTNYSWYDEGKEYIRVFRGFMPSSKTYNSSNQIASASLYSAGEPSLTGNKEYGWTVGSQAAGNYSVALFSSPDTYTTFWAQNFTIAACGSSTKTAKEANACTRCTYCNKVVSSSHSYGSWTTTKSATCTESGSRYRTCSTCGYQQTETISATGHNYSSRVTAPTCTAQGYTTHTCSRCGNSYKATYTNATGHSYSSSVTKAATCTADGVRTYTCSKCSNSYTEAIPKLGHDYKATVTAPTCTAQGYTTHTCSRCGDSYKDTYTNTLSHIFTVKIDGAAPGYTRYQCSSCTAYEDRINSYTLTVNPNGGVFENKTDVSEYTQQYQSTKSILDPTRIGYTFMNWLLSGAGSWNGSNKTYTYGAGNGTLTANWSANKYTVKYNGNNHTSGETVLSEHTYDVEQTLTPNGYHADGFHFIGWATTEDGAVVYKDGATVKNLRDENNAVVDLYARWEANTYTIKYDANVGEGTVSGIMEPSQHVYNHSSSALTPNAFSRAGYTFEGWNTMADGSGTFYSDGAAVNFVTNHEEEVTLYAVWKPITYKVQYHGNGDDVTGTMEPSVHTYDAEDEKLTANGFKKPNHIFTGWNTKADGSGERFGEQAEVKNLTTTQDDVIELYAQWEMSNCDITVTKTISAAGINFAHGNPTFIFKVTGTKQSGAYYQAVELTRDFVESNTADNGMVTATVKFTDLAADVYTVTEVENARYGVDTVVRADENQAHVTVGGNYATINLNSEIQAKVIFNGSVRNNRWFSDNHLVSHMF